MKSWYSRFVERRVVIVFLSSNEKTPDWSSTGMEAISEILGFFPFPLEEEEPLPLRFRFSIVSILAHKNIKKTFIRFLPWKINKNTRYE